MSVYDDEPKLMTIADMDALADLLLKAASAPNLPKTLRDYYDRAAGKTIDKRVQMKRAQRSGQVPTEYAGGGDDRHEV